MRTLLKSLIITTAALFLLLGLTIIAPLILAGAVDGSFKYFEEE